ncbi:N-acetylmannosaminyltransferase [hydrothermal vent metagenome]|uniref:N-acetylmannosaminyltransferase n=1 Tax=hydrothermal vent metagenome TaxID=652676 RepID=A0A3B0Y5L1_9ZZZZ
MTKFVNILGYQISSMGVNEDVNQAFVSILKNEHFSWMACANPHSLVEAHNDKQFSTALHNADILLPDGSGIVLAARMLGLSLGERVAGFDFYSGLNSRSQERKLKYFFLGSTEKVLVLIKQRLKVEFPNIEVVGTYSPPFKPEFSEDENNAMIEAVNTARPDVLWVGMTAPKQEKWIHQNRKCLRVPFVGAIGAVFDFYAGTKYRAPQWLCALGLEWLPRFIREPRRLWRRNLVSTPVFILRVLQQKFG